MRRAARHLVVVGLVASTFGWLALVVPPLAAAAPQPSKPLPPPPNTIHHTKIIGTIHHALRGPRPTCPSAPAPAPAGATLAYLAEPSSNEVQIVNEDTGALVGTPITVGTSPKGIAYWEPPGGSGAHPLVVVSNNGSSSVTVIDAVTKSVVATISLPSGSNPTAVGASTSEPYAVVVDAGTGKASIINLSNDTDAGEISLTTTANDLNSTTFASNGTYDYVTDPNEHHVFVLEYTGGSAPYFTKQTTYTNSSYKFAGIATDLTTSSSSALLVTDGVTGGHLLKFDDGTGTLSAPTVVRTFGSVNPGAVSLAPGGATAYVVSVGTKNVEQITVSSGADTNITPNGSYTQVRTIGLSADGATLMTSDTGSGGVQETSTTSNLATNSTTADSSVWAIAPALGAADSWNAYVGLGSSGIDVVNTGTDSVAQTITDAGGAEQVAASPDGRYVYVVNSNATVSVVQTSLVGTTSNPIVATISGFQGSEPNTPTLEGIAVSPSGDSVIVGDPANGAVDVVDTNAADGSSYRTVVNRIGVLGSGINSTLAKPDGQGFAFSPDGLYGYVTEVGDGGGGLGTSTDGVTVLSLASATTTGYSFSAVDEALTQNGSTMVLPNGIALDPNGEHAYVSGTSSSTEPTWELWSFPIQTNGQLGNNSGTNGPVSTGVQGAGIAYSPEDDSAFVSNNASYSMQSVSQQTQSVTYTTATTGYSGPLAVSPDGSFVATLTGKIGTCGVDAVDLFNAGTGVDIGAVGTSVLPQGVAFAPQSSPQTVSTTELAGGATNPAELAVTDGMNDVVGAGTPSDAPGAAAGVDTATGAYSLSIDSMTIPDLGPSLDLAASYDSSRAATSGLLGNGWDFSYGMTAAQNAHNASTNPCAIVVTQSDAATVTFYPSAQGPFSTCPTSGYEAPGWAEATLTFQSSCNGTDACFVVTIGASTTYSIDEVTGQLLKVADLNGNAVTLSWGSHAACSGATSTEPCQVTAADGTRTLTFSYPSAGSGTCPSGSVTCVVVTDPLGRTVTYVTNASGDLTQVSLANGTETATYVLAYSSHLLTSWWDPQNNAAHASNTAYATDVTYTSGRVTQVTGPVIASVAPLSTTAITPTTTFAYEDVDTATGDGTVLVQNADFNQQGYEPGASQTLDTYAGFQLVSSVTGYGPVTDYYNGSTAPVVAPNPSESAYPLRDGYNLMPAESMNALAGSTESAVGTQSAQYDSGITSTTYDAVGNALSTTDPSGATTTTTYNALNEPLVATDALGNATSPTNNQTIDTYSSTGELLTSTSPPTNAGGSAPETSSFYNSNGTICASRDADQVAAYGTLSSCVSAGTNATTYTYDASGDQTLSTVTDSSTSTSSTQSIYDADGNVCATLSPDGYAITGDRLSSCPSSGAPYATVTLSRDAYGNPTETRSSLSVSGTNTYATSYTCTDANGSTTASVGPMGSFSSCGALSPTTSVDASFTTYDAEGDTVQSIAPLAVSGTQGPTATSQLDAGQNDVVDLSAQGYVAWEANNAADLTGYETSTLTDSQGNTVASTPTPDDVSSCVVSQTDPCPDTSVTTFDAQGQQTGSASAGNGDGGGTTPTTSTTTNNPNGAVGGTGSSVGGGSGVAETAQQSYDANGDATGSVNEHWTGTAWATDSSTSTAYAPDGSTCWTSPTTVSSPTCTSPPTGTATESYYDASGNLIAQVGAGGSGSIGPGGSCNPLTAVTVTAYSINTSDLCAFTTYYVHNQAGQLTETVEPSASSSTSIGVAAGATTTYSYDASGNQTSEVNPAGNTVTSTFDGANRLIGVTYSDVSTTNCSAGGSTQDTCYGYNADGTRSQLVDSTGTTTYSYDGAKHLVSVTDSNGSTVTYGYSAFGQQTCIGYPGFASADSCVNNPDSGTNTIDPGEVWYAFDKQGRLSSLTDWNGDAFTYGYDCAGDVAWLAETPASQTPTVAQCQGSSGTSPSSPVPSASGTTFVVTSYTYSSGGSGNLLTSQATSAVTHSGSTSLLEFDSLSYDDNNNLTSSTPKVSGTAETADNYAYDNLQRVTTGPETSGSKTSYSYVSSTGTQPFFSSNSVDGMGIDAMPESGATAQLGAEYAGNGELCWVAIITSTTTGSCASPGSTSSSYETTTYNSSGDLTATASTGGYGSNSALSWNADLSELTCINPSGTTCTGPSSSQPSAMTASYQADGLRTQTRSWSTSTSSVVTTSYTWDTGSSALLSNGTFDYLYGLNSNVPIAQLDTGNSVTSELQADPSSNLRGIVEVGSGAAHPDVVANYTDYDAYGNPITKNGGSTNPGGLTSYGESGDPDSASSFGFGGGYDDATGLIYLLHRYFNPAVGQFISVDSDLGSTENPYAYAVDAPTMHSDPKGTRATCYKKHVGLARLLGSGMYCLKPTFPETITAISQGSDLNYSYKYATGLDEFSGENAELYIYAVVHPVDVPTIRQVLKGITERDGTVNVDNRAQVPTDSASAPTDIGTDAATAIDHDQFDGGCNVITTPSCRTKGNGYPCPKPDSWGDGVALCWGDSTTPTVVSASPYNAPYRLADGATVTVYDVLAAREHGTACSTTCLADGIGMESSIDFLDNADSVGDFTPG
jgi:RHS repeat-associated protein